MTPEIVGDYDTHDYYDLTQDPLPSEEDIFFRLIPHRKKQIEKQHSVNDNDLAKIVTHVKEILNKPVEGEMDLYIDKFETLGWEQSTLYDIALYIFDQNVDNWKIWLCLNEERCEG